MMLLLVVALLAGVQTGATLAAPQVPKPAATTPAGCVKEANEWYAAQIQARMPNPAAAQAIPAADRVRIQQDLMRGRTALASACAGQFSVESVPPADLAPLSDLYALAAQPEMAASAIRRALTITSAPPEVRAAVLSSAIKTILREPKGDERNARLERLVDELDANAAATLDQKFSAHQSLEGYYRGDDIDAGIIKHATWMAATSKSFDAEWRTRAGDSVVQSQVNMAEALAGQGMNDAALALLRKTQVDWADRARMIDAEVKPTIARYLLVGSKASAVVAPHWLNAPANTTSLPMTGSVTLLEFTAHWCGPCRESYPGINRLRAKYSPQGFRVVMATQLWGYFGSERNIAADAELAHDATYFAEYHLDVPVAVGNFVSVRVVDGKVQYVPEQDPNDTHYAVGGIPQIHLIDKHGILRLIMVGYDDANEPKLSKMIEALLKEQ